MNGTFLKTSAGAVYEIAGGAPFALDSWKTVGGQKPYVLIAAYDISHRTNPAAHLRPAPASGTVVTGLPSRNGWRFSRACRIKNTATHGAAAVPDYGIAKYPVCLAVTTSRLPAGTVGKAYSAVLTHSGESGTVIWTLSAGKLPPGLKLVQNGKITGKPSKQGTWSFAVKLSDSAKSTASRKLSIEITK